MSDVSLETVELLQSATSKGMQMREGSQPEGSQPLITETKRFQLRDPDLTPLPAKCKCCHSSSSRPYKKFRRIASADERDLRPQL